MQHEHLAGAAGAGAYAYGGNAQPLSDQLAEAGRNRLEHQQLGPRRFELERVREQLLLRVLALALDTVAAELVHRLGRETEVTANRNAALREEAHRLREFRTALELHHLGAGRHQFGRAAECLLRRFLIASEGHVGDEETALAAARDAARMVGHVGERHRKRGLVSLQHHAERVSDEEAVETRGVEHRGEARVIAGEDRKSIRLNSSHRTISYAVFCLKKKK